MKSQGRAVWRRFTETMSAGRIPHREIVDGVLVIFGGAFLITPGFITDILGFLLLIPPTRALFRRGLQRRLELRVIPGRVRRRGPAGDAGYGDYVDSTATEHDPSPAGELPPSRRPRT